MRFHRLHLFARPLSRSFSSQGFVDLSPRRALIQVSGSDAFRFLHGLLTNEPPQGHAGVYATLLNPRGRIMYDVFVYATLHNKKWASTHEQEPTFLVEHDAALTDQLYKYLSFRRLRERVTLSKTDDWKVWFAWEDIEHSGLTKTPQFIGADDTRAPGFGVRIVLSNEAESPLWPLRVYEEDRAELFTQHELHDYDVRRITYGVPEGVVEFEPGEMLPIESGIDIMGGIDFHKGCYVGQELTTRAKRVGVTKRRVVPYSVYDLSQDAPVELACTDNTSPAMPVKLPIVLANTQPKLNSRGEVAKPVGKTISRLNNIGFATVHTDIIDSNPPCRLVVSPTDDMTGHRSGVGISFFRPSWWPESISSVRENE